MYKWNILPILYPRTTTCHVNQMNGDKSNLKLSIPETNRSL